MDFRIFRTEFLGFQTETWSSVMVLHFDDFQLDYSLDFCTKLRIWST